MKKIIFLIIIMLLFVRIAEAQTHPHLFFDSSTMPSIRAKASDASINKLGFSSKAKWDSIISLAQTYFQNKTHYITLPNGDPWIYNISDPLGFPPSHSSYTAYPVWTGLSREIEVILVSLSLSYVATNNITYAEKLKNFTISLANWNKWTDPEYPDPLYPAPISLDTAHLSIAMALSYDTIYNLLTDSERNVVRNAIINRGIIPLYDNTIPLISKTDFRYTYHNHYALLISGLGLAATSIMDEDPRTEEWINCSANSTIKFFGSNGIDLTTYEGQEYGSYAVDNLMMLVEALKFNNLRDLYIHPFVQNIYKFPIYFISPDGKSIANFADSTYDISEFWSIAMPLIASRLNNPYAQWYLAKTKLLEKTGKNAMFGNMWFDNSITPVGPTNYLPASNSFNDVGHVALRTGWDSDDWLLAFKSGIWINYSHLHLDQNSFMLNIEGSWLLTDPGYQDYFNAARNSFSFGTVGHNTILVDGNLQNTTNGFNGNMNGNIKNFFTSDYYDYVVGEASNAYSKYNINQFSRHILLVKPRYFLIYDDIKSSTSHQYDFLFHTDSTSDLFEDSNNYFVRKQNDQILIKQYSSANLNSNILLYPGAEGYGPYIDTKNQVNQNDIKLLTFLYPEKVIGLNLLSNPGFERYTGTKGIGDGWLGRGQGGGGYNGTYSIDEAVSHSGSRSQKLSSTNSSDDGYVYQTVPVTEGKNYTLTAWIKTDSAQEKCGKYGQYDCSVAAHIWFVNSSDGSLGWPDGYADNETFRGTHDWTQTFLTIKAPPKAAKAKIVLSMWGNGTAWFDDISFKEVTEEVYEPVVNFDPIFYNNEVAGGIINYDDTKDAVIINTENVNITVSTSIGNITSDAEVSILRNLENLESFAVMNGTNVFYNKSIIFKSENKATINFERYESLYSGFVNTTTPETINIYTEKPVYSVSINNKASDKFSYDIKNKILTLDLDEAFSEINVQCEGDCNRIIKPNEMIAIKISVPDASSSCNKEVKLNFGGILRTEIIRCAS